MHAKVKMIRNMFAKSDKKRDRDFTIPEGVKRIDDIRYGKDAKWNLLDVYMPEKIEGVHKTIISVHGGAWVYGEKETYQYYCMDLARRGFIVVNMNYRLAPENPFPAALEDINKTFWWVNTHGEEYQIDKKNLFVVGDSAGAQLASQYITLLENPEYQKVLKLKPPALNVKGVALNCGVYDMKSYYVNEKDDILKEYFKKDVSEDKIDVMKYMNEKFPPAYIMTAHGDFLKEHADPLYEKLRSLGVNCTYRMYGEEENQEIGHVFHLNIALKEAKECNDEECRFFDQQIQ
ncbi:esterase/lipase [Lachnospiraceae bacterium KM106-2]|nr:esterase/lipase [Lachnospiraceae bacterium KM106-2]